MIEKTNKAARSRVSVDSVLKSARRADVSGFGIVKSLSPKRVDKGRRSMLGGILNGRVVMPDSPSMTLPELLREAEVSLTATRVDDLTLEHQGYSTPRTLNRVGQRNLFTTPVYGASRTTSTLADRLPYVDRDGPRDWTKNDWRLLDACFTDERIVSGHSNNMADAVDIDPENVVVRFITLMGGEDVIAGLGSSWTRLVIHSTVTIVRKLKMLFTGTIWSPEPKPCRKSRPMVE